MRVLFELDPLLEGNCHLVDNPEWTQSLISMLQIAQKTLKIGSLIELRLDGAQDRDAWRARIIAAPGAITLVSNCSALPSKSQLGLSFLSGTTSANTTTARWSTSTSGRLCAGRCFATTRRYRLRDGSISLLVSHLLR